jgi:hypothetical protein
MENIKLFNELQKNLYDLKNIEDVKQKTKTIKLNPQHYAIEIYEGRSKFDEITKIIGDEVFNDILNEFKEKISERLSYHKIIKENELSKYSIDKKE